MPETKNSETQTPLGRTNNQAVNSKTRHSCCLEGLRFPHTGCMENENNNIYLLCFAVYCLIGFIFWGGQRFQAFDLSFPLPLLLFYLCITLQVTFKNCTRCIRFECLFTLVFAPLLSCYFVSSRGKKPPLGKM